MKRRRSFPIARVRRLFATLPMFESLNESALDRMVRGGRLTVLGPGEILFEIGQAADRIHVVVDGALEILRPTPGHPEPEPVAYLTPGEVIGSVALLTGTARRSAGRVP
ncbi:MAG: cyclic nucleotide-binding domain-containing protein, partial [Phycisphaeraceae bacterium]|nr:cyclic nucleotide-binding domain-containing protein [Phycisphaeraceae bacterium]